MNEIPDCDNPFDWKPPGSSRSESDLSVPWWYRPNPPEPRQPDKPLRYRKAKAIVEFLVGLLVILLLGVALYACGEWSNSTSCPTLTGGAAVVAGQNGYQCPDPDN